jgi:iron(III) transport system substrate-binding protein
MLLCRLLDFRSANWHSLTSLELGLPMKRLCDLRAIIFAGLGIAILGALAMPGCQKHPANEVLIYCAVDQPYASKIFEDFEKQNGIHVSPLYDIESSKSVGLAGKLEAERDHPRAQVWWGSEAFLTTRLADEGILQAYDPPAARDIDAAYKDSHATWTGVGLRARVLAVGVPPPGFAITGLKDLLDPRLKGQITLSHPTAGATGAHLAALYAMWGPDKARQFLHQLHDNGVQLVGGNAEVADQVGAGSFILGLTDSDDVTNAAANGGKLTSVVPDQNGEGTLAMPTTVALVKGGQESAAAKKLVDFLVSRSTEQRLIDMKFARWSVRAGPEGIKAMKVDYRKASQLFPMAMREGTAILEGRAQ